MYKLLLLQFLRTKTCRIGLFLLLGMGIISLVIGKQFLNDQKLLIDQVEETHQNHFERNLELHGDELPLLLYYLKFSFINKTDPLAGFSIGHKDLNPSVQRVTLLTLEGQKHDTELVNPTKLLYGNLDFSFVIIYIFPLIIIAFTYNLYSEEKESGTWSIVNIMAKSKQNFLLAKLSVRFILVIAVYILIFSIGTVLLQISLNETLWIFLTTGALYVVFWFALCFFVVCLKQNSNFNALTLLTVWLILVVLLPAFVNNYITVKYPIPEALSTIIKQRDGYHEKWDTSKKTTMAKFYQDYPQFSEFGNPPEQGFNWGWYFAMQHLGDQESRTESAAMSKKVLKREEVSRNLAAIIPSMHVQLAFNDYGKTGLNNQMQFLNQTSKLHEEIRIYFYPLIFSEASPSEVNWSKFKPSYFSTNNPVNWLKSLSPLIICIFIFSILSMVQLRRIN